MKISNYTDYRLFLGELLAEKSRKNHALSLRAFAKNLNLSPSYLSRVLKNQRHLSTLKAMQISRRIGLTDFESNYLISLIELEKTKNVQTKAEILKRISTSKKTEARVLKSDVFNVVSDWHHFAILSLSKTKKFQSDFHWIGRQLGIHHFEAKAAVGRLLRVGLLKVHKKNWVATNDADFETTDDISSVAIQENHLQVLKRAQTALVETPVKDREFGNISICIHESDFPKLKLKIRHFLQNLDKEFDQPKGDEVYQVNIQMHPLTFTKGI